MPVYFFILLSFSFLHASVHSFKEVWAYVMQGEEIALQPEKPITDVAYFSATVGPIGRLGACPKRETIQSRAPAKARIHCVISSPGNLSLMYWCLSKDLDTRQGLLEDILQVAASFDGIQIDFEVMRPQEKDAYCNFLRELRERLPAEKMLSAALPARTAEMKDAFPYQKIGEIVDRVVIMAYDEHWRTGPPGSIASTAWCQKVCNFAKQKIAKEKLILGIPLYGRIWQKQEVAKALKYFQTLELWKKVQTLVQRQTDETPFFEFEQKVDAVVFYEDARSLQSKLACYSDLDVDSIALWRLSQEPAALWSQLQLRD